MITAVLLFLAITLGTVVRLNYISGTDFPVNDGGFFYQLTMDLMENRFRLPEFTSYNHAGIPYAYPPFAFYLLGVLNKLTGVSIITLLNYVPFLLNLLTIPIFFSFTKTFFYREPFLRGLATYFYATLPRSYEWFLMGGGITRCLGYLFAMTALLLFSRSQDKRAKNNISYLVWSAFFSGLTFLSHPVAALFLVFSIGVVCIYYWPVNLYKIAGVGLFAMLISAPWWITVLRNHGLSPFIGATSSGHINWYQGGYLITQNFEYENRLFLAIVSILAVLGLFSKPTKRGIILGTFFFGGYLVVPRGGIDLLTIFLAMLAAAGFSVIISGWQTADNRKKYTRNNSFFLVARTRIYLFYLVIYVFLGSYTYKYVDRILDLRLTNDDLIAMTWISKNTEPDSIILHIPSAANNRNWPNDYIGEWLPAITERENISTVQGYEWLPEVFADKVEQYLYLRSCPRFGISCIEDWQVSNGYHADYLYISTLENPDLLINNILSSPGYETVFASGSVTVIKSE